jgi:hypothetical protein
MGGGAEPQLGGGTEVTPLTHLGLHVRVKVPRRSHKRVSGDGTGAGSGQ